MIRRFLLQRFLGDRGPVSVSREVAPVVHAEEKLGSCPHNGLCQRVLPAASAPPALRIPVAEDCPPDLRVRAEHPRRRIGDVTQFRVRSGQEQLETDPIRATLSTGPGAVCGRGRRFPSDRSRAGRGEGRRGLPGCGTAGACSDRPGTGGPRDACGPELPGCDDLPDCGGVQRADLNHDGRQAVPDRSAAGARCAGSPCTGGLSAERPPIRARIRRVLYPAHSSHTGSKHSRHSSISSSRGSATPSPTPNPSGCDSPPASGPTEIRPEKGAAGSAEP
jgi:hypothetical protein